MTSSTRTAILISVAYALLALWMLESSEEGATLDNVLAHGAAFVPLLILWAWWLYKKLRR